MAVPNTESLTAPATQLLTEPGYRLHREHRALITTDPHHQVPFVSLRPTDIARNTGASVLNVDITGETCSSRRARHPPRPSCWNSSLSAQSSSVLPLPGSTHWGGDLASGQSSCRQREHHLVDARQPALALVHQRRFEAGLTVARHVDLNGSDLGGHRLGPSAVARISAVIPGQVVGLRPPSVRSFPPDGGGFQHLLRQPREHPVRANQLQTLTPSGLHEPLGKLPLTHMSRHGLDPVVHGRSFLRAQPGVSDQTHRSSGSGSLSVVTHRKDWAHSVTARRLAP